MNRNYDLEEQRNLEAHDIAAAANSMELSEECWGMESYGGSSLSGYAGIFFWFSSKEELLEFTVQHLPFLGEEIGCDVPFDGAEKIAGVVDAVKEGSLTWDEGRISITNLLTECSEIRWWGQLKDLFDGDSEFAQELRACSRSDDEDTSPIKASEKGQFMEYLKGYAG